MDGHRPPYPPIVSLVPSVLLSASGLIVAAVAFFHRDDPDWRRAMVPIMAIAIAQVTLGVVSAVLIR